MTNNYTYIGKLKNGEQCLRLKDGSYGVEREYKYLTEPTAEEMKEIEGMMKGDGE